MRGLARTVTNWEGVRGRGPRLSGLQGFGTMAARAWD